MTLKVLLTGAAGMLGQALQEAFAQHRVQALTRREMDITDSAAVRETVTRIRADWVLHVAAFTHVDRAETESDTAHRVNALGTRNLAAAAREAGSKLLYCSTDYVFDGSRRQPYREWDDTRPINQYGRSKLAGEWLVRSLCPGHLIVRTSWLFGPGGRHFVGRILELARQGEQLRVVQDQIGSPTYTPDLALMIRRLVEANRLGTYHVTGSGECSWYEFAQEIARLDGLQGEIIPVRSEELNLPAARPAYSVLDNCMLRLEGWPGLRSWQSALGEFLKEGA